MVLWHLDFKVTNVLKGQLTSAQWQRLGNIEIEGMCGLKAQLNLPFQGAVIFLFDKTQGAPPFGGFATGLN